MRVQVPPSAHRIARSSAEPIIESGVLSADSGPSPKHGGNVTQVCGIGEGIAAHREQIRVVALRDAALAVPQPAGLGRDGSGRAQGVGVAEAGAGDLSNTVRKNVVRLGLGYPCVG